MKGRGERREGGRDSVALSKAFFVKLFHLELERKLWAKLKSPEPKAFSSQKTRCIKLLIYALDCVPFVPSSPLEIWNPPSPKFIILILIWH